MYQCRSPCFQKREQHAVLHSVIEPCLAVTCVTKAAANNAMVT